VGRHHAVVMVGRGNHGGRVAGALLQVMQRRILDQRLESSALSDEP
jgi:hypothetical protein